MTEHVTVNFLPAAKLKKIAAQIFTDVLILHTILIILCVPHSKIPTYYACTDSILTKTYTLHAIFFAHRDAATTYDEKKNDKLKFTHAHVQWNRCII